MAEKKYATTDPDGVRRWEEMTWQKLVNRRAEARLVFLCQEMIQTGGSSLDNRMESHQTPLARDKQALCRHAKAQAFSKVKMLGLLIGGAIVVVLLIASFWPALT